MRGQGRALAFMTCAGPSPETWFTCQESGNMDWEGLPHLFQAVPLVEKAASPGSRQS